MRNNSVPIVLAVLPGTGLSYSTYKLEMILVCADVNPPKASSFIITLTNLAGGVVSYSEGPGIAINGDYTLSFSGQYSVANSGNSARMMRTTILQV